MKYYKQGDECTFEPGQEEYELLEALADKLMELSPNGFKYWVDDVYLDYGSKWMWTTIISEDTISPYFQSTYQALSPAEWLALMNGEDITEIAEHVLGDKYCPDKIKSSKSIRKGTYITSSQTVVVDPSTIPNIRKAMRNISRDDYETTLLIPGWGQIKKIGKRYAVGPLPEDDDSDILTDYSAWSYDVSEGQVLDWIKSELNSVNSSTNTCNIASKPVFGDDDFEEDESDPRYEVCGYYDSRFYGLGDSEEFDDLSDAEDYVWSLVNQGYFTTLEDRETGEVRDFSPNKLDESLEANGEVYDITDAEI